MQEHFLLVDVKSLEFNNTNQKGHFTAIASTQNVDKTDEVVVQSGISFIAEKIPFLHEHRNNETLGTVYNYDIVGEGLKISAFFDLNNEIKSTLNNKQKESAYILAKNKLGQLSIGYRVLESHKENGIKYLDKIQITEISFTTNPANTDTHFIDVKNMDSEAMRIKQAFRDLGSAMNINNTIEEIKKCEQRGSLSRAVKMQMNCSRKQADNFIEAIKFFYDKKNNLTIKSNECLTNLTTEISVCDNTIAENISKPTESSVASSKFRRFYGALQNSSKKD